jgi:predicted transcriptional regulator
MGSTTVHIPDDMLARIDAIARRRGTSRNRVVLASLEAEIIRDAGEWPETFFASPSDADRAVLVEATREIETVIAGSRKNRGVRPAVTISVLDTSACAAAMRYDGEMESFLQSRLPGEVALVPPVVAEIEYGIRRLEAGTRKRVLLERELYTDCWRRFASWSGPTSRR